MAKKDQSNSNVNTNTNVNNNTNNVNVVIHKPRKSAVKKKAEPDWYSKTIIGGIIALILSLCGYFIKNNMDDKGGISNTQIEQNAIPIQGEKQN